MGTTEGTIRAWMSEFREEIPAAISASINSLGIVDERFGDTNTSYRIYQIPEGAKQGDNISPKEWIQVAGTADRLTVEAKFFSKYGLYRQYVVGRKEARTEQAETESIQFGEHQIPVRPSEVLTAAEAIQLFLYFYDNNRVEAGWHLRELPDYAESQT